MEKLKNEFRSVMLEQRAKGKMLVANKTIIFKHMDHLKILLTGIGKIFLCNIQINDEIVHTGVENFMILGYNVDEKNIKHQILWPQCLVYKTPQKLLHISVPILI